ncbi:MFS general substrate transporter [Thozetella sp. PMI_491]|nr:MFS general substrate transporter [Thozetella sp. PMI_491]
MPVEYLYLTFATDLAAFPGLGYLTSTPGNGVPLRRSSFSQYEDPQGWPQHRKTFVTWLSCLSTFVTTYTPGAYAAGKPQYQLEWGISSTAVYAGITLFTLCFAVAPLFLASFSELTGRRPLFLAAGVVYVASQLGSALTASFAGLLATRALAGLSCSVFSTVVGGVISDIYVTRDRNTAMAIFSGAALCGTGLGPLVSGVMVEHLSWRWIYYLQTITCGLVVAALFLFFPETRGSVILSQRARALNAWCDRVEASSIAPSAETKTDASARKQHPRVRWKVEADEQRATLAVLLRTSLTRPIQLLVSESVVFWFSLWMGFAWSILYLTFEAVPLIFAEAYGFSPQAAGLCFLAVSIASILAAMAAIVQEHISPRVLPSRLRNQPEARLFFTCVQSLFLPVGLFWLGATARPAVPWIVPTLSLGCLTLGIFSVYLAVFNYLADTYQSYASSAIAAQAFTRNVFAACLPLAVEPMLNSLGFLGAGFLLGGIGLALGVVPWVLVIWGPNIRERSKLLVQSGLPTG